MFLRLDGAGWFPVLLASLLLSSPISHGAETDARSEVAAALYAASATQAASERLADAKLRAQRKEIEQLRLKVSTSASETANLRSELASAEEKYVAELADRDRAYREEIAVFHASVQDIASTPEGAAALARYNAGDEVGALAILDDLTKARDKARQKREQIEAAADRRRTAMLALDARAKGKVTTEQAIARFEEVTRLDPGVHWDWVELSRLYQNAGRLSDARVAAEHAATAAGLESDQPVALNELGDVQVQQGDLAGALTSYRKAQRIAEALAGRDPENTGWQLDLSVSYERVGGVLAKLGDLAAALDSYHKSLSIWETLAGQDPGNAEWQRGLSVSCNEVGGVLAQQGDLAAALASYREAQGIAEALAGRDPENTGWQLDLSVSYQRVGDVLAQVGHLASALASDRKSLSIMEALVARDPTNTDWQRDLVLSNGRLGDVQAQQGNLGGALASYRKAQGIADTLAGRDPTNTEWQRDLSVSYEKVGGVQAQQGDLAGALASYRKTLGISETLVARDPANADWQRDLMVSLVQVGRASGDKSYLQRALSIALSLKNSGKLDPADEWIVDTLRNLLAQ